MDVTARHEATTASRTASIAMPRHVGLIMDGNRRWARAHGHSDVGAGHQAGAEHLTYLLEWLVPRGIDHASAYVLSADNIRKRSSLEVGFLFHLIENVIPARVLAAKRWRLHVSGDLDLLPPSARQALLDAVDETRERPRHLTLAIGYDARSDILAALRRAVAVLPGNDAAELSVETISKHFSGGPNTQIDLIIRTGGDARISGFFPWQSTSAELYVAQCAWPDFREQDLDAALAHYATVRTTR